MKKFFIGCFVGPIVLFLLVTSTLFVFLVIGYVNEVNNQQIPPTQSQPFGPV